MTPTRAKLTLWAVLATVSLAGCDPPPESWVWGDGWEIPEWDPDSENGADSDSGSAADTESDTGVDTEHYVACDGKPSACEDIGPDEDAQFYGCCFEGTVYWCQYLGSSWLMVWKDCEALGLDCDYLSEQGFLWCV